MKKYLLFIVLMSGLSLLAQDLRQLEVVGRAEKLTSEFASRRDRDGNMAAAIQVVSDLDGFSYDAFNGVVGNVDSRPGMDIVYLQTTERVLEIYKTGFEPLKVILSEVGIRLQAREVWKISITGEKIQEVLPVVIRFNPEDAKLLIDGEMMSKAGTYPLALGAHELRIEKEGYQAIAEQIVVDEQNILFEYELERQPDALVEITTVPAGAKVYLDGIQLGETPVAVYYKSGSYTLKIVKEGYVDIDNELIELELPTTRKNYTLEENVGYLTMNTPEDATVSINGKIITERKNIKLAPQVLRIKVSIPKAEPLEQNLVLNKNDHLNLDLYPKEQMGSFQLAVSPFDAQVILEGDAGELFSSKGSKVFEDIPVGSYNIKVSAAGYETKTETIVLNSGDLQSKSIKLEEATEVSQAELGIEMIFVQGGTFTMGCTSEQGSECDKDEKPVHQVTLGDFYIGKFEVTQKQWRDVMGRDPSALYFRGCDNCPVERVSWNDIQEFIGILNQKTGKNYRLPTEAEWEYAARGGLKSNGYKYAGSNNIGDVAWYDDNSSRKTHPVGGKKPNELNIYDMSGNVWEWCSDWYGSYSSSSQRNPEGSSSGVRHVLRGGGWRSDVRRCRVSDRRSYPDGRDYTLGLRLAVSP